MRLCCRAWLAEGALRYLMLPAMVIGSRRRWESDKSKSIKAVKVEYNGVQDAVVCAFYVSLFFRGLD